MAKANWKKSEHYQRIIEILDAYWLSEPDELKVRVNMDFIKANGETQRKSIVWINPNYKYTDPMDDFVVSLADMNEEYFKRKEQEFWDISKYERR